MTTSRAASPQQIQTLIDRSNLAQADIHATAGLDELRSDADHYLHLRIAIAQELGFAAPNAAREKQPDGFVVIRPWGYGFWSDVDHVLGGLLVAEITGRQPVVHWGTSSLFGGTESEDAFRFFFEPPAVSRLEDIPQDADYYPPKWTRENLCGNDLNKMSGPWSRVNAIYLLNRPENVVVVDFYTKINQLMRWLPSDHPYFGKSLDQVYRMLIARYLRPQPAISDQVREFVRRHFAGQPFAAMHLRGLDKVLEVPDIEVSFDLIPRKMEAVIAGRPDMKVFLLTDSMTGLDAARARLGDRVVTTGATRASGKTGVHYLGLDGRRLGVEMMIDSYVAAQAERFIGIGLSNVSLMIAHVAGWPADACELLGPRQDRKVNFFLNDW